MKKLVILLSVFTLTACSTQSKPVEHKEKHKVVKVKKKKTTQPSSNSSSSSSSSSTAPSSSSETQTQTAPVEQAPAQSQPDGYYTDPIGEGGFGPTQAQADEAQAKYGYVPGYGGANVENDPQAQADQQARQQWHDDQVQWAQDQGLIDQNGQ